MPERFSKYFFEDAAFVLKRRALCALGIFLVMLMRNVFSQPCECLFNKSLMNRFKRNK